MPMSWRQMYGYIEKIAGEPFVNWNATFIIIRNLNILYT